jgi:VCBS repeat protein
MSRRLSVFVVLSCMLAFSAVISCGGSGGGGGGGGTASCTDGMKNGNETDVDCGGSCPNRCAVGKACGANNDCQTEACCNNVCLGDFASLKFDPPAFVAAGAIGGDPQSVATADFNNDKKLDVAVANNTGNVSILIGKGDGTFEQPKTDIATQTGTTSVAAGDLNGDTKPDLVAANTNAANSNVDVLINNGSGSFTVTNIPTVGNDSRAVALGDFDGKNGKDIAVSNAGGNDVTILLNNGSGSFSVFNHFSGNGKISNPRGIASADFNADGKDDLVVANFGSGDVVVLLSDGNGGFPDANAKVFTFGTSHQAVALGDYNKDGKLDIAVTTLNDTTVSILKGDGAGGFTVLAPPNPVGKDPDSIAAADFNLDGNLDLGVDDVFGQAFQEGDFVVLLGKGDDTFQPMTNFNDGGVGTTNRPRSVAVGDLNGDCKPDVILANDGGSNPNPNTVSIFLNTSQ